MTASRRTNRRGERLKDGYVRLIVTRGAGSLGLDIRKTSDPQVIIIADTITLYPKGLRGRDEARHGEQIRNHPAALSPRIKSLNYLNNILGTMRLLGDLGEVGDGQAALRPSPS